MESTWDELKRNLISALFCWMDEICVGDGGELDLTEVFVFFDWRWEIEIYHVVSSRRWGCSRNRSRSGSRSRSKSGHMRSLVPAQGLTGLEDPETNRTLVDLQIAGTVTCCISRYRRIGSSESRSRKRGSPAVSDLLVTRPMPTQCLVRAEHLFACLALVLVSASWREELELLFFFFIFIFLIFFFGFIEEFSAISHPYVSGEHHEGESYIFLRSGVGYGAHGFGFGVGLRRVGKGLNGSALSLGSPSEVDFGRFGLALSVLDYRHCIDCEGELRIH